jgi:hypothetical protein
MPTVTLPARLSKNKKGKVQPLPVDVADALRTYLADKPADQPVWPGSWREDAAEMLRIDLEAAGIAYIIEGPDGPLYADFHALWHSYLTLGGQSGIDLRTLQELAGHSSPTITARYSHRRLHDLAGPSKSCRVCYPKDRRPKPCERPGRRGQKRPREFLWEILWALTARRRIQSHRLAPGRPIDWLERNSVNA